MQADIAHCLDGLPAGSPVVRVLIAYSGGMDSTVLLHAALQCAVDSKPEWTAVHVNHGLHADADEWEWFCRRMAKRLGVSFQPLRVSVAQGGRSLEKAARDARNTAFKTLMRDGDVLMTAHHRDDQAETVLLQLLRGGGPAGLAAMPVCTRFGAGCLVRPLLNRPRAEIEQYARAHHLEWLDDPANDDLRYDRNYLRRRLAPLLNARWPGWCATVSRAARHQAEACSLIRQIALQKYPGCCAEDGTLLMARCLELSAAEKNVVLRYWLKQRGLPTPSEKQLQQLNAALLSGCAREGALIRWPGAEVRYYRGRLYAMHPLPRFASQPTGQFVRHWRGGTDLELPEINATLTWQQLTERAPELSTVSWLTVRLRRGGEKYAFKSGHKCLKKVFQERGVPPWERARVPLIYVGDELRVVWVHESELKSGFDMTIIPAIEPEQGRASKP